MNKNILGRLASGISLIILLIIASYISNALLRAVIVFIFSVIFDLVVEIIEYAVYKKSDLLSCLKEIKADKNKSQKQASFLTLIFVPVFKTAAVLILSVFIDFKF